MRLLIYLLALMSGFSVAEAARAEVTPSSSVTQSAIAAAEALVAQEQQDSARPANVQPHETAFADYISSYRAPVALTPITRRDLSLQ